MLQVWVEMLIEPHEVMIQKVESQENLVGTDFPNGIGLRPFELIDIK
jgi:hypothetical protein